LSGQFNPSARARFAKPMHPMTRKISAKNRKGGIAAWKPPRADEKTVLNENFNRNKSLRI
jgi:hypothetical protein